MRRCHTWLGPRIASGSFYKDGLHRLSCFEWAARIDLATTVRSYSNGALSGRNKTSSGKIYNLGLFSISKNLL